MKSLIYLFLALLTTSQAIADDGYAPVVSTSFGMYNITVTENESSITSTDTDVTVEEDSGATSVAAAVTVFEINYEFLQTESRSFFLKGVVPLISAGGSSAFLGAGGMNWFFKGAPSVFSYSNLGSTVFLIPKLRYYVGGSLGVGYLIYDTESAKKSDIYFDLGFHAGVLYNFGKKWGMRAEVGMGRGTGVTTSSMGMKIFIGSSFYM
jgi:hypothetical protein